MITVTNLNKVYGNKKNKFTALEGVNLSLPQGKTIAIIGKSGSGKSTLMHLLAGLDRPSSGEIIYNEENINKLSEKQLASFRNKKIGFIFQQFFLQPNLSVLENVLLPLKIDGTSRTEGTSRALKALEEVDLVEKAKNKATDLSGGQKQRASIARAIVTEPQVIFADEPTGNLDSENSSKIIDLLFDLNKKKGITLVIVTHDNDIANLCDEKIVIKDGKIVSQTTKS